MRLIWSLSTAAWLAALAVGCAAPRMANAQDGAEIYQAKACASCHHPSEDRTERGLGPSTAQIQEAYSGDLDGLVSFLRGNGEPRLYPEKYAIKKPLLAQLEGLSDAELRALAQSLLER